MGHHAIEDTKKADECVVIVSSLDETMASSDVLTPLVVMDNKIDDWTLRVVTARWFAIDTYIISTTIYSFRSRGRTQTSLSF